MINAVREDHELSVRVAWYYYKAGMTQEQIAQKLGLNRARVIKILDKARREGIISFQIHSPYTNCLEVEEELKQRFGLRDAVIIPEVDQNAVNRNLGAAGAQYVAMNLAGANTLIGVGFGSTVSYVVEHLSGKVQGEISLVTLSGGISAYIQNAFGEETNPLYRLAGRFHIIPAPLLVTSAQTCQSILKEPEIARIMKMAELAHLAMVGIGAMTTSATFVRHGYIAPQELELLKKQGAVGDILGQFYDQNGKLLDVDYHQRLISTPLSTLRNMPHVIGLAGGDQKVEAIRGALKGEYIHSLIIDERTARRLMN